MENKFMPPPPSGMRNNMPPPPPPRKEFPDERTVSVANTESGNVNMANQPSEQMPPKDFPSRIENGFQQPTKQTNVVSDQLNQENNESVTIDENSKEKSAKNLKSVIYWGGFVVSVALCGLFLYLIFL